MKKIRYFERIFCVYALELRTKITLGVCFSALSAKAESRPSVVRAILRGANTPSGAFRAFRI